MEVKIKLTYEKVIKSINSHLKFGIKPGLSRIRSLLKLIGNPQNNLNVIHVAGTNGKGSTCELLASIFKYAGYKVGLYTSPSIIDFRDRIKINSKLIPKNQVVKVYSEIENYIHKVISEQSPLTEFEIITAMALKYFNDQNCDIVILETGLGGRLDATNVIKSPLVSILTSISLDHTHILGNTLQKITLEKCGIIKENTKVITSINQKKCVLEIIKNTCKQKNASLTISNPTSLSDVKFDIIKGTEFSYNNQKIHTSLIGLHQMENIANVLSCIDVLKQKFFIPFESVKNGIENLSINSRIQIINYNPLILLDGSHNLGSIVALKNVIEQSFNSEKLIGIVGMFKDKDVENSLAQIVPIFSQVITVPLSSSRTMSITDITKIAKKYNENTISKSNIKEAIDFATSMSKKIPYPCVIVVFGSLSIAHEIFN